MVQKNLEKNTESYTNINLFTCSFAGFLQEHPSNNSSVDLSSASSEFLAGIQTWQALINEILADLKGCPYAWGAQRVESMFFILVY